ncbi:hypothetical protein D9M68_968590 [compost metagenome]
MWSVSKQQMTAQTSKTINNQSKRFEQNLSIGFSPGSSMYLSIKGRHIYAIQASTADINYLFLDAKVRWQLNKWHSDLELDLTNLTDITNYQVMSLSSNQFALSKYTIRGRMGILRVTFRI